jgi:Protein of unknown function (DUF3108)
MLTKQLLQQTLKQKVAQRYLWALALSIVLHIWLVNGFDLTLPSPATMSVVEVRLVAADKPAMKEPEAKKQTDEAAEDLNEQAPPTPESEAVEPEPEQVLEENAPTELVNPLPQTQPIAQASADQPKTPANTEVSEPNQAPSVPEEKPNTPEVTGEPIPALALIESGPPYTYVSLHYDLFRGIKGAKIGKAHIIFEALPEKRYMINSVTEPMGIAKFFVDGALTQTSTGEISETGFRPGDFTYLFAEKSDKTRQAFFDWQTKQIKFKTQKGDGVAELAEGSQDLLSFMFQFMYVPPLQTMQIWIADGKRLRQYDYMFEGEETLTTEMGDVRTLHIANVKATSDEKTELWLAVDYRNLPVKIRKTEKDGSVIEQVITSLSTQVPR